MKETFIYIYDLKISSDNKVSRELYNNDVREPIQRFVSNLLF